MKYFNLNYTAHNYFNILVKMKKDEFLPIKILYKICVTLDLYNDEILEFTNHEHA